jgi:hypothetical protein
VIRDVTHLSSSYRAMSLMTACRHSNLFISRHYSQPKDRLRPERLLQSRRSERPEAWWNGPPLLPLGASLVIYGELWLGTSAPHPPVSDLGTFVAPVQDAGPTTSRRVRTSCSCAQWSLALASNPSPRKVGQRHLDAAPHRLQIGVCNRNPWCYGLPDGADMQGSWALSNV